MGTEFWLGVWTGASGIIVVLFLVALAVQKGKE